MSTIFASCFVGLVSSNSFLILIFVFLNIAFLVDLLQMLEFNVSVRFPAASLFTVILALCGKFYSLAIYSVKVIMLFINIKYIERERNNLLKKSYKFPFEEEQEQEQDE